MTRGVSFVAEDIVAVQKALRAALGMGDELFTPEALAGMLRDEIAAMRTAGRSDEDIAAVVAQATGKPFAADLLKGHPSSSAGLHPAALNAETAG